MWVKMATHIFVILGSGYTVILAVRVVHMGRRDYVHHKLSPVNGRGIPFPSALAVSCGVSKFACWASASPCLPLVT